MALPAGLETRCRRRRLPHKPPYAKVTHALQFGYAPFHHLILPKDPAI